jgi:hypothetical protein
MPDEAKKAEDVKEEKTIDLDTSGPDVEVTLPEEKDKAIVEVKEEVKDEKPVEEPVKSDDAPAKSDEQPDVQESKPQETEEQKQEELEDYSKGVKSRIAKLTKRMREAERQREAALTYAKSVQGEQKSLKDRLAKLDTGYVKEMEDRITSSLTAAQTKLQSAREAGDITAEVTAQKEIAKLGYEEARLAEMKVNQKQADEQRKTLSEGTIPQIPTQPTPDPAATQWAQKNTWFGKDSAMTYTAFDLHKKLVDDEGYDPQSTDYYGELDRRIRLEFPQKFGNNTEQSSKPVRTPVQTVASATRSGYKDGRRTVKLTSSQVAIANKLNVPLEEYAKQVNIVKEK